MVVVETVFKEVDVYASHHQSTVSQYIVTIPIMDFCLVVERRHGARVYRRLWEQGILDLEGMQVVSRAEKMV